MNRIDRATIVLGLTALLAVLAVTAPASAMNDPVTGRWITRDPMPYNEHVLTRWVGESPPGAACASRTRLNSRAGPIVRSPARSCQKESANSKLGEESINVYAFLMMQPNSHTDPTGLLAQDGGGGCSVGESC